MRNDAMPPNFLPNNHKINCFQDSTHGILKKFFKNSPIFAKGEAKAEYKLCFKEERSKL